MDALEEMVREAYERTIGLELSDLAVDWDIAVDCCITKKAPCGGGGESWRVKARWSGERGASNALGGRRCRWGIPLGYITAPGQPPRLAALVRDPGHRVKASGSLPEPANVHLDRGYDSDLTRKRLEEERSLIGVISEKGKPAPLQATKRWVAWSARTPPGITLTRRSWCGVPSGEESGHRLLGGLLEGDHHRGPAHPKSLDSLPLGEPPFSQTVTYWRGLLSGTSVFWKPS